MKLSRGTSIGILAFACVLLAMLLAWVLGSTSAPSTVATDRQPPPESVEGPPEPALVPMTGAEERIATEKTREVQTAPNPRSDAVLNVLVVSRSTRAPLAGIRVYARAGVVEDGSRIEDVGSSRGGIDRAPITGADGRVEFDLPSNTPIRISTKRASGDGASASYDVPALEAGEERNFIVGLRTDEELRFCGIVLAREDRRPIAGALVHIVYTGKTSPGPEIDATSNAEGRFEIQVAAWRAPPLRIEAPTWGAALVCPESGHETPATELVVLLGHTASMRFHLIDADGSAVAGARILAKTEGRNLTQPQGVSSKALFRLPDPCWSAETDDEGKCLIENIPPGAPLTVEITQDRKLLRREIEPWTLRPGEVRELEWRVGIKRRLTGRVVDQANALVANRKLWVLRPESELPEFLTPDSERRVAVRATTNREGAYAVEDLGPGRWCIGPAPSGWNPKLSRESAIAPLAVFVEIPEGTQDIRRDLVVHRGLYIRGRVLDPSGVPVSGASVLLSSGEVAFQDRVWVRDDGVFECGPLVPARYRLSATAGGEYVDSDQVEAFAGDEGVVFRLKRARSFSGTVVDAVTGAPCSAQLTVMTLDAQTPMVMHVQTNADGTFRINDLGDGIYDVAAHTGDALVGFVRGIHVAGGSGPDGVEVRVAPGAKLGIRYEGDEPFGLFEVSTNGVRIGIGILRNGTSKTQIAPVGRVSLMFKLGDPVRTQERTLDLVAGEDREVVFTDRD